MKKSALLGGVTQGPLEIPATARLEFDAKRGVQYKVETVFKCIGQDPAKHVRK